MQRLDSKLRELISTDARRTVLLGRSKKIVAALLVAKRRRGGDSEDTIEQLAEDVLGEDKRQIVERILGMVKFSESPRTWH